MKVIAVANLKSLAGDDDLPPVVFQYDEGVTVAVIDLQGYVGIGVARCNPNDVYNKTLGERIALSRAIKRVAALHEQVWINRTRTKEQVAAQRAAKRRSGV